MAKQAIGGFMVTLMRQLLQVALTIVFVTLAGSALAQPVANQQQGNLGNVLLPGNGQGQNALLNGSNATTTARQGASANADFESLMDLIQSTVATASWAANGGGEAEMRPFPGGVLVDAAGTLMLRKNDALSRQLLAKRGSAPRGPGAAAKAVRTESDLRFVSLPRLEREIARRQAAREPLEPAMLTLAGLQRVQYVFVYPETGDLVLAGPAGEWRVEDGRIVSTHTGQPVVRLDDLLVLLRRSDEAAPSHFGCSINPRQQALANTQAFLASSSQKPLETGQRKKWLAELRDTVGKQDIEIFGIDPTSRVAGVLVEADYHMKLIGMGLADGVESYLDSIEAASKRAGTPPPPMSVLRWWFALNYESIEASQGCDAFELVGQGVRVLSENELLAAQGRRLHTGQSDPLNRKFAASFTARFAELSVRYPVYGELRNIFDLAMAVALIERDGLAERVNWTPTIFANADKLQLPLGPVPRQVETVISHRIVNHTQIVAGVSGGVMVAPEDVLREIRASDDGRLDHTRGSYRAAESLADTWWWDTK